MQVLGNPQVLTNFIRKQRALDRGSDIPSVRPALIILGGGVAGANGASIVKALAEVAPDAANVLGCVSVGAAIGDALLAGMAHISPHVFESLPWNKFIKGRPWNKKMEIDQVVKTLRMLDQEKVRAHRSNFIVYATEYSTGNSLAIDAKQSHDIVDAVQASMMFPGLCSGTVRLDGKEVVDGACGMPFPIRHIVKKYRPTDILIIFNRPLPEHMGWVEWHLFPWLARGYLFLHRVPRPVRDSTAAMDKVMAYEMQMLTRRKAATWKEFFLGLFWRSKCPPLRERKIIRWWIVAPEPHEAISRTCMDRTVVRNAGKRAYAFIKPLLKEAEASIKE